MVEESVSLVGYLLVENPNAKVRKSLAKIYTEHNGSIMEVKRLSDRLINIWCSASDKNEKGTEQTFDVITLDEKNGDVIASRKVTQSFPQNGINML